MHPRMTVGRRKSGECNMSGFGLMDYLELWVIDGLSVGDLVPKLPKVIKGKLINDICHLIF
jgi:hypothetical protein